MHANFCPKTGAERFRAPALQILVSASRVEVLLLEITSPDWPDIIHCQREGQECLRYFTVPARWFRTEQGLVRGLT